MISTIFFRRLNTLNITPGSSESRCSNPGAPLNVIKCDKTDEFYKNAFAQKLCFTRSLEKTTYFTSRGLSSSFLLDVFDFSLRKSG